MISSTTKEQYIRSLRTMKRLGVTLPQLLESRRTLFSMIKMRSSSSAWGEPPAPGSPIWRANVMYGATVQGNKMAVVIPHPV